MNYVYMLECCDGSLYTGWTNNIVRRVATHQRGKGGKYTASRLPVKLVYLEEYESEHEARSREVKVKALTRTQKLQLIENKNTSPS